MAIRLFDRIRMLLKADAHGVVESLEERSLLLKQYVREAEIELDRKRARLEAVREEEKLLCETLGRREEEVRSLDEDVTLALGSDKEELARFAIRRLLPRRHEIGTLATQIEGRAAEAVALAERVEEQQQLFETLRARVRADLARGAAAEYDPPWACELGIADQEVELELLRRRQAERGAV